MFSGIINSWELECSKLNIGEQMEKEKKYDLSEGHINKDITKDKSDKKRKEERVHIVLYSMSQCSCRWHYERALVSDDAQKQGEKKSSRKEGK